MLITKQEASYWHTLLNQTEAEDGPLRRVHSCFPSDLGSTPKCPRHFLSTLVSSNSMMSSLSVRARVMGKESSLTPVNKTRAILSLPCILQILDTVLPLMAHQYFTTLLPSAPECFVAARPYTQVLDVAHGIQSVLEKGIDDFGSAAAAQCDIQQYYDSLPILKLFLWLVERGFPLGLAAALIRHQVCPTVELHVGAAAATVLQRCIGGLTGSRIAGVLARIPVESIFAERAHIWKQWGFRYDCEGSSRLLCAMSYIDNLFSVSKSPTGAIAILEDMEECLCERWSLKIKPDSRSYIVAAGSDQSAADEAKWPRRAAFHALGHIVQDNGSFFECWSRTKKQMWGAFWANAGTTSASRVPLKCKLMLVNRALLPILDFRCSRWPPQQTVARELDSMQRKMLGVLFRLKPTNIETPAEFSRRRSKLASSLCRDMGWWSCRWSRRVVNWHEHLRRPANSASWAAKLLDYRGWQWLAERRAFLAVDGAETTQSALAGRTATRATTGVVHRRWHDGVAHAAQKSACRCRYHEPTAS